MNKKIAFALCATLAFSVPAFAQSNAAAPSDQGGKGGAKSERKELVQGCRTQIQGQGLKGKDKRQAIMDCVVKQNPAMAGVMKCRMEAKDKGLSGDEMKSFVKDCKRNSHG